MLIWTMWLFALANQSLNQANFTLYKAAMAKEPPKRGNDSDTQVITRVKTRTQKPAMYKVVLLNDDYTPMEFVIYVLDQVFNKTSEDAYEIMMHVHMKGVGVCGVYSFEVAETKLTQVMDIAKDNGHPLQCKIEPAD